MRRGARAISTAPPGGRRIGGAVLSAVDHPTPVVERPGSIDEAAALLRALGESGRPVRVRGGGTKLGWGASGVAPEVEIHTAGLDQITEHNAGDFTAVLEAGVPFDVARASFAQAGQMLALDPPLGAEPHATIGGVVATADSGPLRHRFGGVRDLILGVTVVLSDGTVAKAGGRVIKNVAGYDLGKLFTGSHGTLGLIASVSFRLHPLPASTATARGVSSGPDRLARAAARLAARPLEADCLDVAWESGRGELLVRFGGATAADQAAVTTERLRELGLEEAEVEEDDERIWAHQRELQRRPDGAVVKVAAVAGELGAVLRAADNAGATVASRAGLGLSWVALPGGPDLGGRLADLRRGLPGATLTVLDGAGAVADPWPAPAPGALQVMERIKARFDPARVFRPGAFVGGI